MPGGSDARVFAQRLISPIRPRHSRVEVVYYEETAFASRWRACTGQWHLQCQLASLAIQLHNEQYGYSFCACSLRACDEMNCHVYAVHG
jgi:hypothetical protein